MRKVTEGLLKTSAIVAAALVCFYVITLDNITNVWQYGVCLVCIVWLLFVLAVKWNDVIKFAEEQTGEIVDIDDYRK